MRVLLRWFLTNKVTPLEDSDAILNANTTIAEVKGLIQIQFGFDAKEVLLLLKDHLLENCVTLREVGVLGASTDPVLLAHVVHLSELESSHNCDVDDTSHDDDLQSFSHADYILAMRMLGKKVAVSDDRLVAMREHAPRQRPAFLNTTHAQQQQQQMPAPTAAATAATLSHGNVTAATPAPVPAAVPYSPEQSVVYKILDEVQYGLRKDGVDEQLAIAYPGLKPFAFWDMRLPNETALLQHAPYRSAASQCAAGEVCVELFYFGEYAAVSDWTLFTSLVQRSLETVVRVRPCTLLTPREAGCMYPLVACPVILHEMDAMELGRRVFDDFGVPQGDAASTWQHQQQQRQPHASRASDMDDVVGRPRRNGKGAGAAGTCAPQ